MLFWDFYGKCHNNDYFSSNENKSRTSWNIINNICENKFENEVIYDNKDIANHLISILLIVHY